MTSPITQTTTITLGPAAVEYRTRSGPGVRVVRVMFDLNQPRFLAQTEVFRHEMEIGPLSLSLDEILFYIQDAAERIGRPSGIIPLAKYILSLEGPEESGLVQP